MVGPSDSDGDSGTATVQHVRPRSVPSAQATDIGSPPGAIEGVVSTVVELAGASVTME